jgi:hypothetical protein
VDVVCLYRDDDGVRLPDGRSVDLRRAPGRELARALLGRSVSIGQRGLAPRILAQSVPAGWQRSPLLRHQRLLVFDPANLCRVERWRLHLDDDSGLEVTEDDGESP